MIKQLLHAELLQSIEKYGVIKGIQKWEDMIDDLRIEVLNDFTDFGIQRIINSLYFK